jgi:hypothetical protein
VRCGELDEVGYGVYPTYHKRVLTTVPRDFMGHRGVHMICSTLVVLEHVNKHEICCHQGPDSRGKRVSPPYLTWDDAGLYM